MQACYVNTTHPDFLSGHKVCFVSALPYSKSQASHQATTIVTERLNANKPPPATPDPKSGKLAAGQINNNKDLDVDSKKEEPSFFGSFFAGKKTAKKGPNTPSMESVSVPCEYRWR